MADDSGGADSVGARAAERDTLDVGTFEQHFHEAYPTLRTIAAAVVGTSDADDVVQEAAIIAMGKSEQFEQGTSFRAWMAAFVRNVGANHRRREQRQRKRVVRLARTAPPEPSGTRAPAGLDPALRRALDQLEEDQRCCLLLRVVMTHTYAEIAETMSIPEATARSHVFRARQRMLQLLASSGKENG